MDKKKKRIAITIAAVVVFAAVCLIALVCLRDDEPVKATGTTEVVEATTETTEKTTTEVTEETTTEATTEVTEEPTTETAASTEKPNEEEPTTEAVVENKPGSTGSVDPAPTEAPTQPAPTTPTPAPKPEPTPAPSAPTEAPKHEHNWVWVETKAASKVWVVDQAAWTEYKEHPAQYDEVPAVQCKYCGEKFTTADAFWAHKDSFMGIDNMHAAGGSRDAWIYILVKEAWTEEIPHEEVGHWEETPAEGYYKCECGAKK